MVDADGATDFGPGLERCLQQISSSPIVFGSRAHLKKTTQRSLVRTMLMHSFSFFVQMLCSSQVEDTQCGFKLFTKKAASDLFENLHLRRWAFDTELVMLAEFMGYSIAEVAVPWQEVDGSKLDTSKLALALVSVSMLREMLCVRACYTLGLWKEKR
jgi:dolichyl-phosphate beta-glucosyltransferase